MDDIKGTFACRPSFRAVDGTRNIDVPDSFSPRGWRVIVGKTVMMGIVFATLSLNLFDDLRVFWLAYLTNWNITISTVYLLLSFYNSIVPVSEPPVGQTSVDGRVKATWITFTISANIGLMLSIAFWSMIYDGTSAISTVIFPHGILTSAVLIDGFGINAIPVRLRHYLELVVPFALSYILWSYLHGAFDIGNPDENDEDPETNDDLIYDVLDWQNKPKATALTTVILVFFLSPILQIVIWVISGYRRRYKNITGSEIKSVVEMKSLEEEVVEMESSEARVY
jgi:hypothetical protein